MTTSPFPHSDDEMDDIDERDWLVQRFVDQDLSPQERIDFLKEMDRDPTLRKQVLATEQMLLHSSQLPRMAVPSGFKDEILKQLATAPGNKKMVGAVLVSPLCSTNLALEPGYGDCCRLFPFGYAVDPQAANCS